MKVLYIAGDTNLIGGIEKYNRDFIASMKLAGVNVYLVERYAGGLLQKVSFLLRTLISYFYFRPNFILCGHLNFSPICFFIRRILGTPYVLNLYGIEVLDVQRSLYQKTIRAAAWIVTISEYTKSFILKQFPEVSDRLFLLISAVDGSLFEIRPKNEELIEKYQLKGKSVVLTLARMSNWEFKGQDRVLSALCHVIEKIPNVVYLIVGNGQDDRVQQVMNQNPDLAKHVIFVGPVENKLRVDFYNLGDVYILPSKFEGFGIVFIESLACGVPVIASHGYGCQEGLLNGELGLVVQPDDPEDIANKLIQILSKSAPPALYDRKSLRQRTLQIYGMTAWNQKVKNLLEKLA